MKKVVAAVAVMAALASCSPSASQADGGSASSNYGARSTRSLMEAQRSEMVLIYNDYFVSKESINGALYSILTPSLQIEPEAPAPESAYQQVYGEAVVMYGLVRPELLDGLHDAVFGDFNHQFDLQAVFKQMEFYPALLNYREFKLIDQSRPWYFGFRNNNVSLNSDVSFLTRSESTVKGTYFNAPWKESDSTVKRANLKSGDEFYVVWVVKHINAQDPSGTFYYAPINLADPAALALSKYRVQ